MNDKIRSIVIKSNRKTFLISFAALILIYFIINANENYFYNVLYGPFPKSYKDLISITDFSNEKERYVKILGEEVFDSGVSQIEQRINKNTNLVEKETTIGFYQLLLLDNKFLTLYSTIQDSSLERIGEYKELSSNLRNEILQSVEMEDGDWLLPVMLDTTTYSTFAYILFIFLIPATIIPLFNFLNSFRRILDPTKHPIYKSYIAEAIWLENHKGTEYSNIVPTCDNCSFHKKLFQSSYRSNVSYFFKREESTVQGMFCVLCNTQLFIRLTSRTLLGTWWGFIGFFVGPIYIIQNLYNYLKVIVVNALKK